MAAEITGQRFPKILRLSGRDEFAAVFDAGRVAADKMLVMHAIRTSKTYCRIGLSVSKKVGSAPTRNYWKRCLREAFRKQRGQLPIGMDLVVRPRRDARADYHAIESSLLRLAQKLDKQLGR